MGTSPKWIPVCRVFQGEVAGSQILKEERNMLRTRETRVAGV